MQMIMLALVVWVLGLGMVDAQQSCAACPPGTFKNVTGNFICSPCDVNTFNPNAGVTSSNQCQKCPQFSTSIQGTSASSNCLCDPGYSPRDLQACQQVPIGSYKISSGNAAGLVLGCPAGSTTVAPGGKSFDACECSAGFEGRPNTTCTQVRAGFYKTHVGNGLAQTQCPANSTSPVGSSSQLNCSCLPGFTGPNGGPCTACETGKFKTAGGPLACDNCPGNSTSVAGSTAITNCRCNPGYHGPDGGQCSACGVGKFSNTTGGSCMNCPENTYSGVLGATSSAQCLQCRDNSVSLVGSSVHTDCKCKAGYWTRDGLLPTAACVLCTTGKFAEFNVAACSDCGPGRYAAAGSTSSGACLVCAAGTFSLTNQSQCDSCPTGTTSPAESAVIQNCTCLFGREPNVAGMNGVECSQCAPGKYKDSRGSGACVSFPNNTYSNVVGAISVLNASACPLNASSPAGSTVVTSCKCDAGFRGVIQASSDACNACEAGKFNVVPGSADCANCGPGFFSTETAKKDSACTTCGNYSISPAGSSSSSACECAAGFERL